MDKTAHNCFEAPDATRESGHGRAEIVNVGDEPVVTVGWFGASDYTAE